MDKGYIIRILNESDLKEAVELTWRVFLEFEAPEYSKEGVRTFWDYIELSSMTQKLGNGEIFLWGCYDAAKLIGVIAFRDGFSHISLLFVDKEYHRQGIAKRLLMNALNDRKAEFQVNEITVNASPYAEKIYEKMGFTPTAPKQMQDGIIFIPMKLPII